MQVKIEKKGDLERLMSITIPAEKVSKMREDRIGYLAKTVKIDGFRTGKIPAKVIEQRFGDRLTAELAEGLINEALPKAIVDEKINMAGQPHIHNRELPESGKDYSFEAHFEVYPEITPKKTDGIKVTKAIAEVTDKEVDEAIDRLFKNSQEFVEKKGKATKGDRVIMDAQGFKKGEEEPFAGSVLTGHKVVIGSGSLIPGFEENLEGLKAGDEKSFNVTFPKDYHATELAGVEVRFDVQVSEIQKPAEGAPTDEFAKNFGMKDLAEMKAKVREQLEKDLATAADQRMKRELFDSLAKDNKFAVPNSLVEAEFNAIWQNQMKELQMRGLPVEALGKGEDELKVEFKELAERRVRLGLLLAELGKQADVKVEDAEINAEIEKIAAGYGAQADQVKAYYNNPQRKNDLVGPLFEQKVVESLIAKAKVTEKKVKTEELMAEMQG